MVWPLPRVFQGKATETFHQLRFEISSDLTIHRSLLSVARGGSEQRPGQRSSQHPKQKQEKSQSQAIEDEGSASCFDQMNVMFRGRFPIYIPVGNSKGTLLLGGNYTSSSALVRTFQYSTTHHRYSSISSIQRRINVEVVFGLVGPSAKVCNANSCWLAKNVGRSLNLSCFNPTVINLDNGSFHQLVR